MPAVARVGDPGVVHCSGYNIAAGSPDVFINNRAAARVGDPSTAHQVPGGKRCGTHSSTIASGSRDVFINGRAMARVGDPLAACTRIAAGSIDVFANNP